MNKKRIWRLWQQEGLKVPQKKHKKRSLGTAVNGCTRLVSTGKDDVWAMDFVFDVTANGRSLKWLAIVDEFTRENLALEVARQFKANDVIDVLRELIAIRGTPGHIRCDNGPEFIAHALKGWLESSRISTLYIEPGSPWQNGYAERFNSRLRDELLAVEIFETLKQAKAAQHDTLAAGVQPPPAARFSGLPDPGEICRDVRAASSHSASLRLGSVPAAARTVAGGFCDHSLIEGGVVPTMGAGQIVSQPARQLAITGIRHHLSRNLRDSVKPHRPSPWPLFRGFTTSC